MKSQELVVLSRTETRSLEKLEKVIERNAAAFVETGRALAEIRDARLYRATHQTFETYCQARWEFTRSRAQQLIAASSVTANLSTMVDKPAEDRSPSLPANERQARVLIDLEPDEQRKVWQRAVETAPDGKVTAKHVAAVVKAEPPASAPEEPAEEPEPTEEPEAEDDGPSAESIADQQAKWKAVERTGNAFVRALREALIIHHDTQIADASYLNQLMSRGRGVMRDSVVWSAVPGQIAEACSAMAPIARERLGRTTKDEVA